MKMFGFNHFDHYDLHEDAAAVEKHPTHLAGSIMDTITTVVTALAAIGVAGGVAAIL